jgi:hypothetical protein
MIDQKKWANELATLTRASVETGIRNLDMLQEQTEKAIDLTVKNVYALQEESQKGVGALLGGLKKAQDVYRKTAEQTLADFEKKTG